MGRGLPCGCSAPAIIARGRAADEPDVELVAGSFLRSSVVALSGSQLPAGWPEGLGSDLTMGLAEPPSAMPPPRSAEASEVVTSPGLGVPRSPWAIRPSAIRCSAMRPDLSSAGGLEVVSSRPGDGSDRPPDPPTAWVQPDAEASREAGGRLDPESGVHTPGCPADPTCCPAPGLASFSGADPTARAAADPTPCPAADPGQRSAASLSACSPGAAPSGPAAGLVCCCLAEPT
jgi:hypothetical protein